VAEKLWNDRNLFSCTLYRQLNQPTYDRLSRWREGCGNPVGPDRLSRCFFIRASSGSDSNRDLGLLVPNQIYIIESKRLGASPRTRISTAALRTARIAGQGLPGLPGASPGAKLPRSSRSLQPATSLLSSRASAKTWDPFLRTRMLACKGRDGWSAPGLLVGLLPLDDQPFCWRAGPGSPGGIANEFRRR